MSPYLLRNLVDFGQVLVGVANDVHDGQQLPQRHGELGGHPAFGADLAPLLLHLIWF